MSKKKYSYSYSKVCSNELQLHHSMMPTSAPPVLPYTAREKDDPAAPSTVIWSLLDENATDEDDVEEFSVCASFSDWYEKDKSTVRN